MLRSMSWSHFYPGCGSPCRTFRSGRSRTKPPGGLRTFATTGRVRAGHLAARDVTQHTIMTRNGKTSVGIIGAGNIAGHHITGYLQASEHAQVTAIADVDVERARKHTERLGDVEVFQDYREMIASAD